MSSAIIHGLIAAGRPATSIIATGRDHNKLQALANSAGVNTSTDNLAAVQEAGTVVLSVKPAQMQALCSTLKTAIQARKPLVISVAAGIPMAAYERWLGDDIAIVRAMPNTPSLVKCGACGLFANAHCSPEQRAEATAISDAVGISLWLDDEALIDAVIATAGSAPAYFFLLMEAMIDHAQTLGLDPEQARRLTLQTALGAARLAQGSDLDVAELRRNVTSPGGTTERAIARFEKGGLRQLVATAMSDCQQRAVELAEELNR